MTQPNIDYAWEGETVEYTDQFPSPHTYRGKLIIKPTLGQHNLSKGNHLVRILLETQEGEEAWELGLGCLAKDFDEEFYIESGVLKETPARLAKIPFCDRPISH